MSTHRDFEFADDIQPAEIADEQRFQWADEDDDDPDFDFIF